MLPLLPLLHVLLLPGQGSASYRALQAVNNSAQVLNFPGGNPACWDAVFTFHFCCDFRLSPLQAAILGKSYSGGRPKCWADGTVYNYDRCCTRGHDGCLPPKEDAHGGHFNSPGDRGTFAVGATATLTCPAGFRPYPDAAHGGPTLTCGPSPDFNWLGSATCYPPVPLPPPPTSRPRHQDGVEHEGQRYIVALVAVITAGVVALAYVVTRSKRVATAPVPVIELAAVGELVGRQQQETTTQNALIVDARIISAASEPTSSPPRVKAPLQAAGPTAARP